MTCVHKVRWSVKRPEDCRFRLSVSHYKDRIVAPDEYSGATAVTPSDSEQVLATKDKTVRANITVNPAPTEPFSTTENGTFTPSEGNVGFSEVVVDVEPSLESLSVAENGLYLPSAGVDGFDRVNVDVPYKIGTFMKEIVIESDSMMMAYQILTLTEITDVGLYLVTAENNNFRTVANRLNALFMFKLPNDATADNNFSFKAILGDWKTSNASRTAPCYCSAGTILRCYRLPFPLPY